MASEKTAFLSASVPRCGHSSFTQSLSVTPLFHSNHVPRAFPVRSRRALRMIGDSPTPPPSDSTQDEADAAPAPAVGASETPPAVDPAGDAPAEVVSPVAGEGEGGDAISAAMGEDSVDVAAAIGDPGSLSFDEVNADEGDDVEVEEECTPPQWVLNDAAIAETRAKFRRHETDTGSPEYQIATLTARIAYMTTHLREHPKDHSSTRGLLKMVGKRTRLLRYLKSEYPDRFHNIMTGLNIRVSTKLRTL